MKILIVTNTFQKIEKKLLITLEDAKYRVTVKEIGLATLVV